MRTLAPLPPDRSAASTRVVRRFIALAIAGAIAVTLAAFIAVVVPRGFSSIATPSSTPFTPSADDGLIAEGAVVTLSDVSVPAIARLNPAVREAMQDAETDAAASGIAFQVTSGWRSQGYQQWLFEDAVELYASEEIAGQYVATPDRSRHVTGDAVDIVPLEAQLWLMEHGPRYGLCQTYANERWHFELATDAGGTCPEMKADAAS